MPSSAEFDTQYSRLNAEQKAAVDAIEGPVFVIAGPGTGKTQVLTLRIANILKTTDTPPESILALTFTDAASHEMRERLRRIIGSRAAKVRIHTFHGFAESVISRYPDQFPRIIGAQIATDAERAEILDSVLLATPVKHLRPFGDPLFYHSIAARAISDMKRENITPDALEASIKESWKSFESIEGKVHERGKYEGRMKQEFVALQKRIEKTEDLLAVYRAYEDALTSARRYDYDDVILEVVGQLESDETFRLQVQETIFYVLADEHQDANRAQNALLELVSGFHDRPNLFIVGDEKQAIYRFQGADLDNVQYFRSKFEGTTILTLVENYRSTQTILDTALSLIAASPDERLSRAPLVANSKEKAKPITLVSASSTEEELAQLSENIKALLEDGTAPGDIAVLLRRNRDIPDVARALMRGGIPVAGGQEGNALQNRFVLALLRLLRVAAVPRDELLSGVLSLPGLPITAADCVRITQFARKERQPILSILAERDQLLHAGVRDTEAAVQLGRAIEELARMASFERPAAVAERALQVSGLLGRALMAEDRPEALAAIRGLLNAFEDLSRREHGALLSRALELIDLYESRNISLPGSGGEDETRVKLMTAHRSKGREFPYVFVPLLTSSAWSTRARPEHFELPGVLSGDNELEDERRLLYVAITRAKNHATLSYATSGYDGRLLEPSELIEDLNPELLQKASAAASADWLTQEKKETRHDGPSKEDLETLRAAFFAQGLSPTALNNYLECPWKYFYVNLLRIPEVENKFMLFGTAVHAALRRYADQRVQGTDIGTDGLLKEFSYALSRSPLSEAELAEMQKKGEKALKAWWKERHESWPAQSRAEVPVQAEVALPDGALLIRGALDRIDEAAGGVDVIDYKTGKPKTRNTLLGNTKDADGNYYRQLTFYKLLLARTEEKQHMKEGIVEFVEPDDKGNIHVERFEISDEDVSELEKLIQKSAGEILELSFWNTPCDEQDCHWCGLRFGL
jgi:DNA helicase-2/ATP-dependent DNA helicase PcrA